MTSPRRRPEWDWLMWLQTPGGLPGVNEWAMWQYLKMPFDRLRRSLRRR